MANIRKALFRILIKKLKMTMSENQRNLEAGLLLNKNRNDINECRITAVVIFSTFVSVCGSFCFGCAVSQNLWFLCIQKFCVIHVLLSYMIFTGRLFISFSNRDHNRLRSLCCTSKKTKNHFHDSCFTQSLITCFTHICSLFELLQYSMFGSLMTFGAMFGAIFSGKVSDLIGRKGVI